MESWTEIKISVDAKDIDRASDIANVVVPYGIYIEDYTNLEQEVEDIAILTLLTRICLQRTETRLLFTFILNPMFRRQRRLHSFRNATMQRYKAFN